MEQKIPKLRTINGAQLIEAEDVAKRCHELNRSYCSMIGDDSQPSWENAPRWQKESAFNGVCNVFMALNAGEKPTPEASHESWMAEKLRDGWKYGEKKDPKRKEHPCMVPFDELPPEQQMKDMLFVAMASLFWEFTQKKARGATRAPVSTAE